MRWRVRARFIVTLPRHTEPSRRAMNYLALTRTSFLPRLGAAAAPWTWEPERRRRVALKWLRGLAIAVAVVLLLWGLLWLAVPPLLKSQLQSRLSDLLGRPVTLG